MSQYAFYFDGTRCTGCKTCVYACKDKYDLDLGMAYRKVREYGGGETAKNDNGSFTTTCFDYPVSVSCNHCDEPACFSKCPQGAIVKDSDTGFVEVDDEKCIGCGTCVIVCPYEAPKVDEEQKKARKCTACKEIVAGGEKPVCVMACPARALDFGPVDELQKKYPDAERANIAPLPAASETTPNLFIKPAVDAKPWDDKSGELANPLEVK